MDEDLLTPEEAKKRDDDGWVFTIVRVDPETEQVLEEEELE